MGHTAVWLELLLAKHNQPAALIIAGREAQYRDWQRANDINPHRVRYINSINQVQGTINPIVVLVGTFWTNPMYANTRNWDMLLYRYRDTKPLIFRQDGDIWRT